MRRFGSLTVLVLLAFPSLALAQDDTDQQVAERFIGGLNARDFQGMADCFSPDAKGRFLAPSAFTEATGGEEIVEVLRTSLAGASSFEIAESEIKTLGTKLHLFYEMRAVWEDQTYHAEQHVYVVFEEGLIASFDLLCSGFFPAAYSDDSGHLLRLIPVTSSDPFRPLAAVFREVVKSGTGQVLSRWSPFEFQGPWWSRKYGAWSLLSG